MSDFKKVADLRSAGLKKLLAEMEGERDSLLDEVAEKKGRALQLERLITRTYELILDINKEEQQNEAKKVAELLAEEKRKAEEEKQRQEQEEFEKAKRGMKTPKISRRGRKK